MNSAARISSVGVRRRSTNVAVVTARYMTKRATALTAASCTNDPVSARANATLTENRIAFDGVAYRGCRCANQCGKSPFSASA